MSCRRLDLCRRFIDQFPLPSDRVAPSRCSRADNFNAAALLQHVRFQSALAALAAQVQLGSSAAGRHSWKHDKTCKVTRRQGSAGTTRHRGGVLQLGNLKQALLTRSVEQPLSHWFERWRATGAAGSSGRSSSRPAATGSCTPSNGRKRCGGTVSHVLDLSLTRSQEGRKRSALRECSSKRCVVSVPLAVVQARRAPAAAVWHDLTREPCPCPSPRQRLHQLPRHRPRHRRCRRQPKEQGRLQPRRCRGQPAPQ